MAEFDARQMIEAAASTAILPGAAPRGDTHRLAAAAERAAAEPVASAMSPIVLAGAVRAIEFALIALIGFAIYAEYVVPQDGFSVRYFIAIGLVSVLSMLAFQIAD